MTRNRLIALALLAVVAALVVLGVREGPKLTNRPTETPSLVPLTWSDVRDYPGHKVHVGAKVGKDADRHDVVCRDCHEETDAGFKNLGEQACGACHDQEVAKSHAGGGDPTTKTTCLTCHAFAKPGKTCIGCHDKEQGKNAAVTVHASADAKCATCHNPHKVPSAKQADCATCHAKITFAHGKMPITADVAKSTVHVQKGGKEGHEARGACTDCHSPHTKAAAAKSTCTDCHKDKPLGAKPSGHEACVTCHAPHDFERAAVGTCVSCHKPKQGALAIAAHACTGCHAPHDAPHPKACSTCHASTQAFAANKVAAHAKCESCHTPHDPKGAPPEQACAKCHANVHPNHSRGQADRCIDCHVPHPGDKNVVLASAKGDALACSSCHTKAKSDTSFHVAKTACATCHKPHDLVLAGQGSAVCARCHASEEKTAHASKGHQDCAACHGTVHAPHKAPACGSCHAAEATSAPAGHAACQNCHVAHDGKRKPEANCASCHAKQGGSAHANVQGGCATCHRPHGPNGVASPPACGSCHTSLPGLHRVPTKGGGVAHATCSTCHTSHGQPKFDRAACTSCHTDRKDHQPQATTCNGCHVFRQ